MMARVHDEIPSSNSLERFLPRHAALVGHGLHDDDGRLMAAAYGEGFFGAFGAGSECPDWSKAVAHWDWSEFLEAAGDDAEVEDVFPTELVGSGTGKKSLNHSYILKRMPTAFSGSQSYGNCRAWSARFATLSVVGMALELGELLRYEHRHGTALVYGMRQSAQQGMTMSRGAYVIREVGQSEEKDYGIVNLSTQRADEDAGNTWGRSGPPAAFIEACRGDVMDKAYHIASPTGQLVKDLFFNECVIDTGSQLTGLGPGNPLVGLRTIGGHAQFASGYDDTDECRARLGLPAGEFVVFMQQSWGPNWIVVNNWPADLWGPRPEGCWPIKGSDFIKLCRQWNDSWAVTGASGFVARRLPDWGSQLYL